VTLIFTPSRDRRYLSKLWKNFDNKLTFVKVMNVEWHVSLTHSVQNSMVFAMLILHGNKGGRLETSTQCTKWHQLVIHYFFNNLIYFTGIFRSSDISHNGQQRRTIHGSSNGLVCLFVCRLSVSPYLLYGLRVLIWFAFDLIIICY